MLKLFRTKTFLREYSNIKINDKLYNKYLVFLTVLLRNESLAPEAKDYQLKGNWKCYREFHISGDLLVIYKINDDTLKLIRIDSHSQLFE